MGKVAAWAALDAHGRAEAWVSVDGEAFRVAVLQGARPEPLLRAALGLATELARSLDLCPCTVDCSGVSCDLDRRFAEELADRAPERVR